MVLLILRYGRVLVSNLLNLYAGNSGLTLLGNPDAFLRFIPCIGRNVLKPWCFRLCSVRW